MATPWYQAYEDIERLFKRLEDMNHQPVDKSSDEQTVRADACRIILRLFTEPDEDGRPFRLGYNAFISGDLGDTSRLAERLVGLDFRGSRKTIADAIRNVVALTFNNTNRGDEALSEAGRVLDLANQESDQTAYPPRRVNLVLAHFATGQAELLRGNSDKAANAFRKAWELLSQKEFSPIPKDKGDAPPPSGRSVMNASLNATDLDEAKDVVSFWFFGELTKKLPVNKLVANSSEALPVDDRYLAGLLGCLIRILVAKELVRFELESASREFHKSGVESASKHLESAKNYLQVVEKLVFEWPTDMGMRIDHFASEISMLKAILLSRDPEALVLHYLGSTLRLTKDQRRQMVFYGKNNFTGFADMGLFDAVEMADFLFIQRREHIKLTRLYLDTEIPLKANQSLVEFDDLLSSLAGVRGVIGKIYEQFKSRTRKFQIWSWSETINALAGVLDRIKQEAPCDATLLAGIVALVTALAKLQNLAVDLGPISEVIRDWPFCPDADNSQANILIKRLREIA